MRALFALALAFVLTCSAQGIFERHSDVGTPSQAGSARFDSTQGIYEIMGGGANIWGTADAFHFLCKQASGDMSLTAKVRFEGQGKAAHRKTGWMVRQTLDADSPWAGVMVHGDGLTSLQYRAAAGGPTQEVRSTVSAPATIRLVRKGDTFTFLVARAGEPLTEAGSIKVAIQDPVYAGLAVCSHDDTVLEKAIFTEVEWSR
jgi:TolB protein